MTAADKTQFLLNIDTMLIRFYETVGSVQDQRVMEKSVAAFVMAAGAALLATTFSRQCAEDTEQALASQGLSVDDVTMRKDASYHAKLNSLFGPVVVCLNAFRSPNIAFGPVGSTIVPTQTQFMVRYPACHSTLLCLEWEARLGADHPFRMAQEQLNYYTHQAVTLEDTTIARHMLNASHTVDTSWLYKSPAQMAELLRTRALCDLQTGRPVVYISSDAHALRRYTDETWSRQWKMVNGIRIWAVDRVTGQNIHLGGEFTWGDCEDVANIFARLIEQNILPKSGAYAGVVAQFVWLADGAPWFSERVIPLFEGEIIQVLDVYHALEYASAYADAVLPKSERAAWKQAVRDALLVSEETVDGERQIPNGVSDEMIPGATRASNVGDDSAGATSKARKGHKKSRDKTRSLLRIERRAKQAAALLENKGTASERVAEVIPLDASITDPEALAAHHQFLSYVGKRIDQMEYLELQSRGIQIGSGAMESLHKSASQVRLKRAGVTCLAETSQAILNWRMLRLSGRWEEFWDQPALAKNIAEKWSAPAEILKLPMAA